MRLFSTREPRKFRRVSIYTDESRDRLQKLVDEVKREQGEVPANEETYDPDKFRGTFINYTPRAQKHKENGSKLGWPIILVILFGLLILWRFLLTGIR
ncbi:MAG: hypothetical protein II675_05750 [Bacteroidaceae bacterium]|nr:hypothetical protein [Bacteroidaceae bacterium]